MTTRHGRGRYTAWQMVKTAGGAAFIVALFTMLARATSQHLYALAVAALACLLFYAGALTWAEATEPVVGKHRIRAGGKHRIHEHRSEAA